MVDGGEQLPPRVDLSPTESLGQAWKIFAQNECRPFQSVKEKLFP